MMTKDLANYLFLEETLYNITQEVPTPPQNDMPITSKKHVWFFGEKPLAEKRDLMVKLLQACQLKGSDVEFYFEPLDVELFIAQNPQILTLIVFGNQAGAWVRDWPVKSIYTYQNTAAIQSFSLDELILNEQQEKRQFWIWLKSLYQLS